MTLYHLPQTITHSLPHHPLYLTHYMTLYHLPYHTLRYTFTFLGAYLMVCKKYTPPADNQLFIFAVPEAPKSIVSSGNLPALHNTTLTALTSPYSSLI